MSEIKDKNQLVIKNSATIELERRKGFVNILLQGNPNLYRAWVERNNKIVIDISGESTEYNLDTQTPDYIEILKDQTNNKYYINFTGSITGEGSLVSDDITFSQEGDNTRLTIKSSKFVSTSKISSGTPDYLYVNVDSSGNVRVGLTQETMEYLSKIEDMIPIKEMEIVEAEYSNSTLALKTNLNVDDIAYNVIVVNKYYGFVLDNNSNVVITDFGTSKMDIMSNYIQPDTLIEDDLGLQIISSHFIYNAIFPTTPSDIGFDDDGNNIYLIISNGATIPVLPHQ